MLGYFLLAGFVCIVQGNQPCGHGHPPVPCTTIAPAEVNHAIVDLSLHYNNDMCLELLLIDCAKHVTQGDEVVCASNGKTYDNHCRFIHARCEYHLIGHVIELTKVHSGPCQTTTAAVSGTMAVTAGTVSTMASSNTTGSGTTMPPAVSASATMAAITGSMAVTADTASTMSAISGATADTTTTMAASASTETTTIQVTTVLPTGPTTTSINNIIQQLFCRNVDAVVCGQDFSIVCGTDGQFYPNSCELSKAKCKDHTLTVEPDTSKCIAPRK